MRCRLTISTRSWKGLISKIRLHNENKLATMLAQLSAAHFHPMLTKIIKQWHWPVLVLCFQHIQMLSDLNWIQKSFFHDLFPPKCGVLQLNFCWNYHWKQALFLLHKPEAFFHANCCHELSHSPIQLDALSIMKNSAVACSFTLVFCTSQSDKKSLIRHHHHQVPFLRRIIVLFLWEREVILQETYGQFKMSNLIHRVLMQQFISLVSKVFGSSFQKTTLKNVFSSF